MCGIWDKVLYINHSETLIRLVRYAAQLRTTECHRGRNPAPRSLTPLSYFTTVWSPTHGQNNFVEVCASGNTVWTDLVERPRDAKSPSWGLSWACVLFAFVSGTWNISGENEDSWRSNIMLITFVIGSSICQMTADRHGCYCFLLNALSATVISLSLKAFRFVRTLGIHGVSTDRDDPLY